ncbi:MAG TPA: PKD domain-containing protein, partial [bacterium]
ATDPGTADVLTFNWNFGDGGTAIGQNVSHTFADEGSGTYTVTLTVNDGKDNGTDQLTVTVSNVAPTAEAGGPYTGTVGYSIQFNGTASDPGSDVLTYTWDLDEDGLYDDFPGPNPQKTYNSVGTYSIGLRVTDGDGGVATDNATVSVSEGVQITIRTSDSGMQVNVDGTMYPSPKVFSFAPGSMHEVNVPYEQLVIEGRQRWVFQSWSDGGQKNHIITVPYSQREYVANYQQFYYLDIDENGMSGGNIQGENWYTPGSVATIHVDAAVTDQAGTTRYQFVRWEGIGSGSYTGSELTAYVHVNEPIVERVIWGAKQYLLSLNSPFGNPTGAAWYAQGATASFSVDTAMNSQSGTRSKFKRWVGQGSGSYTGSVNTATITMNNPVVEQAEWNTEYYLDLVSAYGAPTGEKWYTAGAQATVSIDTVAGAATDTRKRFLQWTGQGGGSYTGGNPIFTIIMNNPITETVQWQQQYHVQVVSFVGIPKGGGWYADGGTASISTDTVVAAGTGVRYKFNQWQGTGTGSYTGTDPVKNIIVHAPMRQEVLWKVQYWITMGIDPVGSGTVTPIPSPGGWGTRLDTLSLKAIGSSQENYSFFEWGGDTTSSTNPLKLVVKKTQNLIARFRKGNITLTTDPVGLLLIVDGVQVVSPYGRNWLQGEKHTIGSLTNQGDNVNTKFVFTSWSDDGALEHSIDVPASVATYTAKFNASYSVNVQSQYGTPTESSWYAAGTTATVKVDTAVEQPGGLRQKFNGWTGTGSGSYTGPANPASFQVNGPIMQKAEWKLQYKLNATTYPYPAPGARLSITPTGPWYDSGNNVQLEVNVLDPSYSFTGWSGDANGTTNPISFIMNAGKNVTANFKTPNSPPQITALPDTSMWEDMELRFSFAWLSRFIRDDNDPLSSLTYELIGTSHFTWSLDPAAQVAILKPVQNWSGTERIIVKVADPMGMFDTDTLSVRVFPMADPPTEFSLLSPKDNVVMLVWNTSPLFFTWQKSTDPDPGDYIRYNFFFGSEPTITQGSTLVTNLQDTSIYMTIPASGVYYWGVTAFDTQGNRKSSTVFRIDIRTDVEEDGLKGQPGSFALLQNYPNPFNPETTIRYALPQPADVRLLVFDLQGRLIRALVEKRMPAGYHEALWDARDAFGRLVPSGVYLLKMKAGDFFQQKRMVLLK